MTDIKIVNENGTLVGYDRDTGEQVPIDVQDLHSESVDAGKVSAEQLGDRVFTVGPSGGNAYQSLATALDDLRGMGSKLQPYTLILTGNLTGEDKVIQQVEPASHVNVDGNGYRVEIDTTQNAVDGRGKVNARWSNLVIDHAPSTSASFNSAVLLGKKTEEDVVFENVTAIGQSQGNGGKAWWVYDDARPTLIDCVGVGGAGGDGSKGLALSFGCSPTISGGVFYGGPEGQNCQGLDASQGAPSGSITGATFIGGQSGGGCHAAQVTDSASVELTGCTMKFMEYPQTLTATGDASERVDAGNVPIGENTFEATSTTFPSFLKTIAINIYTAATGATIDIGTTVGGTEIASGIDASSTSRVSFPFNHVEFAEGDSIYVTCSDQTVEYMLRYVIGVNHFQSYGLYMNSRSNATVTDCSCISAPKSPAVYIDQTATDAKKYSISGGTAKRMAAAAVGRSDSALVGQADAGAADPIGGVVVKGTTSNVAGAGIDTI